MNNFTITCECGYILPFGVMTRQGGDDENMSIENVMTRVDSKRHVSIEYKYRANILRNTFVNFLF